MVQPDGVCYRQKLVMQRSGAGSVIGVSRLFVDSRTMLNLKAYMIILWRQVGTWFE
jgi:hypothetical protein